MKKIIKFNEMAESGTKKPWSREDVVNILGEAFDYIMENVNNPEGFSFEDFKNWINKNVKEE